MMHGFIDPRQDEPLKNSLYRPGQRWVSSAEPEAGLGIIVGSKGRNLEVSFPAIGEKRFYAIDNAPLNRIQYREGEQLVTADGEKLTVVKCEEQAGRYYYLAKNRNDENVIVDELELDSFVCFSAPRDKLFSGQIDSMARYKLRRLTLEHENRLHNIKTPGLLGARLQLLPHQFYIASEVASRHAPRVLLADEVGLGKTIEAGLILHQQLVTGKANRVLVVVPESLIHQWLVEMLRRFNLMFTIVDAEACVEGDKGATGNPFEQAQLILCSLTLLVENPTLQLKARNANWDVMVVDEAHHLHWHNGRPGKEYRCIQALAKHTPGLILLTATPEQLGLEGHFARLKLLDPHRYHELKEFKAEEAGYCQVRQLVEELISDNALERLLTEPALSQQLATFIGEEAADRLGRTLQSDLMRADHETALEDVIQCLVDRHGTGRVLFRNTREAVSGFPRRVFNPHPLPAPQSLVTNEDMTIQSHLRAEEILGDEWVSKDPRVKWLAEWLPTVRDHQSRLERVLVICASARTAAELESCLSRRWGVKAASFHEGMSLVHRDRAAAYFADDEDFAQALICSEIGSEGRNFQFVRHLVLFDLPLNPDLLEQRIGRLDRIGQKQDVQIHVPYYDSGIQQFMVNWYHRGLNAFERVCPVGGAVYETMEQELLSFMTGASTLSETALVEETRKLTEENLKKLREGRDRLLEMSSCHPRRARQLIEEVQRAEDPADLSVYMEQIFDQYGVDHGYHSLDSIVLFPGDHMYCESFPGLLNEGMTVTYHRDRALVREDMHFLSWEHPMVRGVMDMILSGDFGSVALCSVKLPPMKPGNLILEAVFTLHCPAPRGLQLHRYLPLTSHRVAVDMKGNDLSEILTAEHLDKLGGKVDIVTAQKLVKHFREPLVALIDQCEKIVAKKAVTEDGETIFDVAMKSMKRKQQSEWERLSALAEVNPNIRQAELDYIVSSTRTLEDALSNGNWRLDSLRIAVTL